MDFEEATVEIGSEDTDIQAVRREFQENVPERFLEAYHQSILYMCGEQDESETDFELISEEINIEDHESLLSLDESHTDGYSSITEVIKEKRIDDISNLPTQTQEELMDILVCSRYLHNSNGEKYQSEMQELQNKLIENDRSLTIEVPLHRKS